MGELYLPKENDLVINDDARDLFFDTALDEGILETLRSVTNSMFIRNRVLIEAISSSVDIKRNFFDIEESARDYYRKIFNLGSAVSYLVFSINEPEDPQLGELTYAMAINDIEDDPSSTWKSYLFQDSNLSEIVDVVAEVLFPNNLVAKDFVDDGSGCVSYFLNYQYKIQQNSKYN